MTQADIDAIIGAYGEAAHNVQQLGFDGVEIHGAHGYLIDQFFWDQTNRRTDRYRAGTLFATEVIEEVRRRVGTDFPVALRFSQWKIQDYDAKLAKSPAELDSFLKPLVDAGTDVFHCSTRHFWDREFEGSDLNLAGWTKKLTGKPAITVGSVTLGQDLMTSFRSSEPVPTAGIDDLLDRLERGEFDLVAVGRSLIVNPTWPAMVQNGAVEQLQPFSRDKLSPLF
jgi:2,4-dienoyl-CoA reductase-like NADH-dependent reductase (Old Yellow Enzyme family)